VITVIGQNQLIFVCYRGSDEKWATELVYARMTEAFGASSVFKAGNSLRVGEVFPPVLERAAASCPVMLACIGPAWLSAVGPGGARALDHPEDWVRREIAISLRAGNHVIPVLLGNFNEVAVPKAAELPQEIRAMVNYQARRLTPGRGLDLEVPELIQGLIDLVPTLSQRYASASSAPGAEQPASPIAPPTNRPAASATGPRSIPLAGDNWGIVSTGDSSTNIQVR
jgi:hypothetical protein